jgi:hypothetical protein
MYTCISSGLMFFKTIYRIFQTCTKKNSIKNSHVPIPQLQQWLIHSLSSFIFALTTLFPPHVLAIFWRDSYPGISSKYYECLIYENKISKSMIPKNPVLKSYWRIKGSNLHILWANVRYSLFGVNLYMNI